MTVKKGSCLCGARTYEIDGEIEGVWICHCSLCRKASGSNGIAIVIVPTEHFHWLSGEDHGVTYELRPTYSISRCKTCGSPLPAGEEDGQVFVTAGSLDDPIGVGIKRHIFFGSKADWDFEEANASSFEEFSR
jgi:hypothetical protein